MFMNDYDIAYARDRFTRNSKPNRLALAIMVDRLREWADAHSDGWAYWSKPRNAAAGAIAHIESTTNRANMVQEDVDITEDEMLAAVRPIKAFLTRKSKVPHGLHPGRPMVTAEERELILRSTRPMFEVI